jgi:hypothetical protein
MEKRLSMLFISFMKKDTGDRCKRQQRQLRAKKRKMNQTGTTMTSPPQKSSAL